MSRTHLALAFGTLLAIAAGFWWLWPDENHALPAEIDSVAGRTDLVVKNAAGASVDLAAENGKIRVVHFWATWCAPCVEELPSLATFVGERAADRRLSIHVVAADEQGLAAVAPFLGRLGVTLDVELDPGGRVASAFGTTKFPETWVLGADGRVLQRFVGPQDWAHPGVKSWFDAALSGIERAAS